MDAELNDGREFIDVVEPMEIGQYGVNVFSEDAYSFTKNSKLHWLQKVCLWTLKKLKCNAEIHTIKYESHPIGHDGSTFMRNLLDHYNNLLDLHYHPTKLLVGSKQYMQLMSEPQSYQYFNFESQYYMTEVDDRDNTRSREEHKLKIEVIPWMDGMILLP